MRECSLVNDCDSRGKAVHGVWNAVIVTKVEEARTGSDRAGRGRGTDGRADGRAQVERPSRGLDERQMETGKTVPGAGAGGGGGEDRELNGDERAARESRSVKSQRAAERRDPCERTVNKTDRGPQAHQVGIKTSQ